MITFRESAIRHLRQLVELKRLAGDSIWHIRAYDRAASSIAEYEHDFNESINFKDVPWVGDGINSELKEFAEKGTNTCKFLDLQSHVPEGRFAYTREMSEVVDRFINFTAGHCLNHMDGKISIAGSVRRGKLWIRDIDLITSFKSELIYESLDLFGMEICYGKDKKIRFSHPDTGLEFDIKMVPEESWYACLLHSTGSMQNNVHMRSLAKRMGYTLNEYGLFDLTSGDMDRLDTNQSEEEFFELLNLPYLKPEDR